MTTLTELRQHPVEILAFVNLIGLSTGAVFGVMTYVCGPGVQPYTLLNGNILLMMFLITYGHLRHSHMWIAFTGLMGRILQSPAHHQLHHSANPLHYDKNLGFAPAVWDWAFGTLAIPSKAPEPITFGVGEDNRRFRSALGNYVHPFARSGEHVLRRLGMTRQRSARLAKAPTI
jgi:sterol desaturase/sphingolipid hydroxylase (fatty acid hydroxylase superfamily)